MTSNRHRDEIYSHVCRFQFWDPFVLFKQVNQVFFLILAFICSASLSIRIASIALMLLNFHVAHLSIRTCEQWQHGWLDPDAVWRGEWGGARHSCVRWKCRCVNGKGLFLAWFLAFFGICALFFSMGDMTREMCSTRVCQFDNISQSRIYSWNLCRIGFLTI